MDIADQNDLLRNIHKMGELLHRLFDAGLEYRDLQTPIDDTKMREKLTRYWHTGCFDPSWQQVRAREKWRDDFIGVDEVAHKIAGAGIMGHLEDLRQIPFDVESYLHYCYVLPMSGADDGNLRAISDDKVDISDTYRPEVRLRPGWVMFEHASLGCHMKGELACSSDQLLGLAQEKGEDLPNTLEAAWCLWVVFATRGIKLIKDNAIMTRTIRKKGDRRFRFSPFEEFDLIKWDGDKITAEVSEFTEDVSLPSLFRR